jgi:3-dehydroquinate dehydratase type I
MRSLMLRKLEERGGKDLRSVNQSRKENFRICTSIKAQSVIELQKKLIIATKLGSDLIEARLDFLDLLSTKKTSAQKKSSETEKLARMIRNSPVPLIATVRRMKEGGNFRGSEKERIDFLKVIDTFHPDYIDLEASTVKETPRVLGDVSNSDIIISYHELRFTPSLPKLQHVFDGIDGNSFSMKKIVTYARKFEDNLSVLGLYKNTFDEEFAKEPDIEPVDSQSLIAFCSGEAGIPSRLVSLMLGSPFMYACLPNEQVAPGQLSIQEARKAIGFLKANTRFSAES